MKNARLYLHHILERCYRITRFIGPGRETFMTSEVVQDAVIRNVEVIGEAAKRVSADARSRLASLDWKAICGMRDVLIHDYIGVDLDEVWNVASSRIPELQNCVGAVPGGRSPRVRTCCITSPAFACLSHADTWAGRNGPFSAIPRSSSWPSSRTGVIRWPATHWRRQRSPNRRRGRNQRHRPPQELHGKDPLFVLRQNLEGLDKLAVWLLMIPAYPFQRLPTKQNSFFTRPMPAACPLPIATAPTPGRQDA